MIAVSCIKIHLHELKALLSISPTILSLQSFAIHEPMKIALSHKLEGFFVLSQNNWNITAQQNANNISLYRSARSHTGVPHISNNKPSRHCLSCVSKPG